MKLHASAERNALGQGVFLLIRLQTISIHILFFVANNNHRAAVKRAQ